MGGIGNTWSEPTRTWGEHVDTQREGKFKNVHSHGNNKGDKSLLEVFWSVTTIQKKSIKLQTL